MFVPGSVVVSVLLHAHEPAEPDRVARIQVFFWRGWGAWLLRRHCTRKLPRCAPPREGGTHLRRVCDPWVMGFSLGRFLNRKNAVVPPDPAFKRRRSAETGSGVLGRGESFDYGRLSGRLLLVVISRGNVLGGEQDHAGECVALGLFVGPVSARDG